MRKHVSHVIISVLFLFLFITGCGRSTSSTPVPKLPTNFASYSPTTPHLMAGAIQGIPLALNNTVSTLVGTAGINGIGFTNYSANSSDTAKFNQPNDITTDGANFYVADYANSLIRRISTVSGVVKTATLICTDNSSGAAIIFNHPTGITTDGINLYVADWGNNCIRVILGIDNAATNSYKVITIGSTSGLAGYVDSTVNADVRFNQPVGITTDGVNIYVTDYNNAVVRWIDPSNNYAVYTLTGTSLSPGFADGAPGTARFNLPTRITTDGASLFVTEIINRTIRQIDIKTGNVSTLAGSSGQMGTDLGLINATGTAARFNSPDGITTDGTNLYVTDWYKNNIRKIVIATGDVTTLFDPLHPPLHTPIGITTDGSSLLVADTYMLNDDYSYTYSNSILRIK